MFVVHPALYRHFNNCVLGLHLVDLNVTMFSMQGGTDPYLDAYQNSNLYFLRKKDFKRGSSGLNLPVYISV